MERQYLQVGWKPSTNEIWVAWQTGDKEKPTPKARFFPIPSDILDSIERDRKDKGLVEFSSRSIR